MPRDGSGIYTQPFPDVVDGTTIESSVHNGTVNDIEQDLNTPRPIVAGGTGANNAYDAMIALKGEIAGQAVTNYDSHPFVGGSFYSAPGATGEPFAGYFSGHCDVLDASHINLQAVQYGGGSSVWRRQKSGGVWGAWTQQSGSVADLDARYVNLTGDTMTGGLTLSSDASVVQQLTYIDTGASGKTWLMGPRVGTGGNSHFNIWSNTSGVAMMLDVASGVNFSGTVTAGFSGATGGYYFGNSGAKSLTYDGTNFVFSGAQVVINSNPLWVSGAISSASTISAEGDIIVGSAGVGGVYRFGPGGTKYLLHDGAGSYVLRGGLLSLYGPAQNDVQLQLTNEASGHTRRWRMNNGDLSILNNAYSFDCQTFRDDGTFFSIGSIHTNGNFHLSGGASGTLHFTSDNSKYLAYGSGVYTFSTGKVSISGRIESYCANTGSPDDANLRLHNNATGSKYLRVGAGAELEILNNSFANVVASISDGGRIHGLNEVSSNIGQFARPGSQPIILETNSVVKGSYGYQCRNGYTSPGGYGGNIFNMLWTSAMNLFVDNTLLGPISTVSDYRIKKDVIDLPGMWDTVKALRPIKYTQADFSNPSHVKLQAQQALQAREEAEKNPDVAPKEFEATPLFVGDDIERWGFIAHELQATLTPSAATVELDDPEVYTRAEADAIQAEVQCKANARTQLQMARCIGNRRGP